MFWSLVVVRFLGLVWVFSGGGINLGLCSRFGTLRTIVGSFWDHYRHLPVFWAATFGHFWLTLGGHFGAISDLFLCLFGTFCTISGSSCLRWVIWDHFGVMLGLFVGMMESFCGQSWSILRPFFGSFLYVQCHRVKKCIVCAVHILYIIKMRGSLREAPSVGRGNGTPDNFFCLKTLFIRSQS